MTTTGRAIRDAAIGGVVTIIGSLLLMAATGALSSKENAADHRKDISELRGDIQQVLLAVCYERPNSPVCRAYSGVSR